MPDAPVPTRVDPQLSSQLRLGVMRLARRLRQQRTDETFSPSQLSALATLERTGPRTLGELAAAERVQPPSMTRIVTTLEQAGLVVRSDDPTDRRLVLLACTPEGTKLLAADRKRRDAWLTKRLTELSPAELETLRAAAALIDRLADT